MGLTQSVNSKANIKKTSSEDLPYSPRQPVINSYYATSTSSQTVINLSFSVEQTLTDQFFLFVDGKKLRLGSSNDYTFTAVGADNTSAQVTLTQALPANLNIQAYMLGLKAESEFIADNRFVQLYQAQDSGFQGFVSSENQMVATTTTGSPAAGTFYSSISGRANMIDLSNDLGARMGGNRIMTNTIYPLSNEFGSLGETVFAVPNDTYGQIRFIGTWSNNADSNGTRPGGSGVANADSIEVTFYGTGLNMLCIQDGSARNFTVGIDGGAQGSNLYVTGSNVLLGRNYGPNTLFNITSGLTLGVHTAKIVFSGAVNQTIFGFEVVNNSSSVKVNPGIAYLQGKRYQSGAQASFLSSAPVTGTRGGRVLVYQNGDGTVSQSFQAVDTQAKAFTFGGTGYAGVAADHTNEEISRIYQWREFGSNRADDFSTVTSANTTAVYTLDDGTTTLVGSTINNGTIESLGTSTVNGFFTITFVGTGLDLLINVTTAGSSASQTISVDGTAVLTSTQISATNAGIQRLKIVSGLPYGTHTVKFLKAVANGSWDLRARAFIVYQPKKPSVPSGTIDLMDYNVPANYVANATAGQDTVGVGVLRKANAREISYIGTWAASTNAAAITGLFIGSSTTGDSINYYFFGSGFDLRFHNNATSSTWQFTIDGATNLTTSNSSPTGGDGWSGSLTTSSYGAGVTSFTASTGTLVTSTTSTTGNGVSITGLTLGVHTVKLTKTAGTGTLDMETLDVVAPIHSLKSNLADSQNILPIGNQGVSDNRKFTPVKDALPAGKAWAQAIGVQSGPTTTSTSAIPMPDMSVAIKTSGGALKVSFTSQVFHSSVGGQMIFSIYIDGVNVLPGGGITLNEPVVSNDMTAYASIIAPVSAGAHKVDVYWWTNSGTLTANGVQRMLIVEER